MYKGFVRIVSAIVVGSTLVLAGAAMATADTMPNANAQAQQAAAKVKTMHDQLESALAAKNLNGISDNVDTLRPMLKNMAGQPWSYRATGELQEATQKTIQLDVRIDEVKGLPDPISMISGLVQSLLQTLLNLVAGLLGGGLPTPPLPPLPTPPLPVPVPHP